MSDAGGLVQHMKLMAELPPRPLPLGRASAWDFHDRSVRVVPMPEEFVAVAMFLRNLQLVSEWHDEGIIAPLTVLWAQAYEG
jgi:hypothetical protein